MIIDFQRNPPSYSPLIYNGTEVKEIDFAVFSGISINKDLKWDEHYGSQEEAYT